MIKKKKKQCPTSTYPFFTKEQQIVKTGYIKCAQLNRALGNSRSITKIGFPLGLCDTKKFYLSNISSPLSSVDR